VPKKPSTAPLKAYEVRFFGEFAGIYVGRNHGQAKAAFTLDTDGYQAKDLWRNLSAKRLRDEEWELAAIEKHEDRGKYWRDTRQYARQVAAAEAFNARYPVGTPVQVIDCCEADTWPGGLTTTRTPAWAPSETCVLVSVEGYAGGFYLKNIKPLTP